MTPQTPAEPLWLYAIIAVVFWVLVTAALAVTP